MPFSFVYIEGVLRFQSNKTFKLKAIVFTVFETEDYLGKTLDPAWSDVRMGADDEPCCVKIVVDFSRWRWRGQCDGYVLHFLWYEWRKMDSLCFRGFPPKTLSDNALSVVWQTDINILRKAEMVMKDVMFESKIKNRVKKYLLYQSQMQKENSVKKMRK